jgi:hypothetical protein
VIREWKLWGRVVSKLRERHPALKHGAYSAMALLPGENPAEFRKLHEGLIAELAPGGALEEGIIATIARLTWRKQNLAIFRLAKHAQKRCSAIRSEKLPGEFPMLRWEDTIDPAERETLIRAAEDEARKELGENYKLVEVGEIATLDGLMKDLEVEERLDGMIDKCLKRLLFVRGLKSLSAGSASAPQQRIAGPAKAA